MSGAWTRVPLREVLHLDLDRIFIDAATSYPMVGVLSFGRGLFDREAIEQAKTSYRFFYRLKPDHVVMSQLFGWEGALALSSEKFAGKYLSPQFPTFLCDPNRLDREYLGWLMRRPTFWADLGKRASGMGDRRRTLTPQSLLACEIPLPPLPEQRRVVARIDYIVKKIDEARSVRREAQSEQQRLLMGAYYRMAANAPRRALGEVAPLVRRPVAIDSTVSYPQIAVRSFGRGTFHKPPLAGSEVTWQKMFLVNAGDILISNIKAWEGAIAVTSPDDAGRFGSHRYLTFVPHPQQATARFICFHLLTPEGLNQVGEASPGSADRNRTLGATRLLQTLVPVPPIQEQLWFDQVAFKLDAMQRVQTDSATELDALLPAVLDRAFKGELV